MFGYGSTRKFRENKNFQSRTFINNASNNTSVQIGQEKKETFFEILRIQTLDLYLALYIKQAANLSINYKTPRNKRLSTLRYADINKFDSFKKKNVFNKKHSFLRINNLILLRFDIDFDSWGFLVPPLQILYTY